MKRQQGAPCDRVRALAWQRLSIQATGQTELVRGGKNGPFRSAIPVASAQSTLVIDAKCF